MRSSKILSLFNRQVNSNDSLFSVSVNQQTKYLKSFPKPKDTIERAYFQYKCQKFIENRWKSLLKEIIAFIGLIPCFIFLFLKYRKISNTPNTSNLGVFIYAGVNDILPNELIQKLEQIKSVTFGKSYFLTKMDITFVSQIVRRFLFSPYFILKSVYKIALYRAIINEYKPKAIICSSEYSFTSSLLTDYCERNRIKHINVMHGEKLLNIRDSFFQFHECYVWDKHYISLFKTLRAECKQFIVDTPPCLFLKADSKTVPIHELTYYLAGETKKELESIKEILLQIKIPNEKICIRPHPRYSDNILVTKVFKDFFIENTQRCSIQESFNNTKRITSLYSTVLYQGLISGREIVVDDFSQKSKFKKLKKLNYIILSRPYNTISSLLNPGL